jgi:hypothetical protein
MVLTFPRGFRPWLFHAALRAYWDSSLNSHFVRQNNLIRALLEVAAASSRRPNELRPATTIDFDLNETIRADAVCRGV